MGLSQKELGFLEKYKKNSLFSHFLNIEIAHNSKKTHYFAMSN
jgi:hypothetical protein